MAPTSGWREVDQARWASAVVQNQRKPKRQQRNLENLALLAASQAAQADGALFFTTEMLLRKMRRFKACAMGACGT